MKTSPVIVALAGSMLMTPIATADTEPVTTRETDPQREIFAGPGTLSVGPQGCPAFTADTGEFFFVQVAQDTPPTERAYVIGTIEEESDICMPFIGPALLDVVVYPLFEECGKLAVGPQGCIVLATEDGIFALENTGAFFPGDRACVVGAFVEQSDLCFPWNGPGVVMNTIQRYFEGCGVLAHGPQTCTILQTDDGEGFALGNLDGFFIGEYVYVTGAVNETSLMCWPASAQAIESNTIQPCAGEVMGDLDGDGAVGFADLLIALEQWGPCPACPADLDGSGDVGFGDLLMILARWGSVQ